jgi:hypothetical protein
MVAARNSTASKVKWASVSRSLRSTEPSTAFAGHPLIGRVARFRAPAATVAPAKLVDDVWHAGELEAWRRQDG